MNLKKNKIIVQVFLQALKERLIANRQCPNKFLLNMIKDYVYEGKAIYILPNKEINMNIERECPRKVHVQIQFFGT